MTPPTTPNITTIPAMQHAPPQPPLNKCYCHLYHHHYHYNQPHPPPTPTTPTAAAPPPTTTNAPRPPRAPDRHHPTPPSPSTTTTSTPTPTIKPPTRHHHHPPTITNHFHNRPLSKTTTQWRSQRLYASNPNKRRRIRVIPEWLEKNALPIGAEPRPPHSVNDPEAFQELINSITEGNTMAVKLFAEAGVNLNMKDSDGCTPLHHAVVNGQNDVIEMLIEKGADSKMKNTKGLTPFEEVKKPKINRDRSRPVPRHKTTFRSSVMNYNTRSSVYTSFDISLP
ncbi:uncharacterized protein [Amphiura filiformis]|uniref:uncharacterized protein n=1 Tax=Amphiura filiformis TaxID=82378 RepID=UPI003B21DC75